MGWPAIFAAESSRRSISPTSTSGSHGFTTSLAIARLDFDVRELLVGAYAKGRELSESGPAYQIAVPASFVKTYGDAGYKVTGGATTILGNCKPAGGPSFLKFVGRTNGDGLFFFRDNDDAFAFGLHTDGWDSNADEQLSSQFCSLGGDLSKKQAMIFVR